ncbi:DUF6843 domain-containing protein [Sinomicrobium sp. M5D2P9]
MNFKINIPVLLFVALSVFAGCGPSGEEAIFVVPENYTGYILVIYDQENGAEKEYKDKARIYRIPSNGILLSKFPTNPGWSDFPKFYYRNIDQENEIRFTMDRELPADTVIATGGSSGYASRDSEGKKGIRFVQYYIGTKDQIDEAYEEAENLDIVKLVDTSQTREGL